VLHYEPGEEFLPHFDFLDVSQPGPAKDVAGRGQRVLTFLIALNDDYDGGETEFPEIGKRWKGRKGSGLFFWNVEPDGTPDRLTRHAGLPPTRGEKWLLSQWIRGRAA
jgi:prolyl 4-hydroxylase